MRLTVCFKTLPDYAMLGAQDWQPKANLRMNLAWARQVMNCYEESALEMGLRMTGETSGTGKRRGNGWERAALTVDTDRADLFLRTALAVGYERAVRVNPGKGADLRFNPMAVSRIIAAVLKRAEPSHGNGQIVIFGPKGGRGENSRTGFLVAERMGWPCIGQVVRAAPVQEDGPLLEVESRQSGFRSIRTVCPPLVLIMGDSIDAPWLRIPTLNQKLSARKKSVEVLSLCDLGLDQHILDTTDSRLIGLRRPDRGRACTVIEGETVREKAARLGEALRAKGVWP